MARPYNPENESDVASRQKLHKLLSKAHTFLQNTGRSVTSDASRLSAGVKEAISRLWADADRKLGGVIESQTIGNPKWRRDALDDAGVFGEELGAKDQLLDYFFTDNRFLAALRFLASLFGSLSKAFPVLSAVKEFIDAVLCCRDWLPEDPEMTTLGELR